MTIELLKKLAELGYVTDTAIIRECELKPELLKTINIYEYVSQIDLRNLNLMDEMVVDSVPVVEPEPTIEPEPEIPEETKEPEPEVAEPEPVAEPEKATPKAKTKKTVEKPTE